MALRWFGVVAITLCFCLPPVAGCTFLVGFDNATSDGGVDGVRSTDATTSSGDSAATVLMGTDGSETDTGSEMDDAAMGTGSDATADEDGDVSSDGSAPADAGPASDPISCSNACAGYTSGPFWVCAESHSGWCDDDAAALDIVLCDYTFSTKSKRCPSNQPCTSGGQNYSDYCNPCADAKGSTGCISNGNPSTLPKSDIQVDCNNGVASNPRTCYAGCIDCDAPK